MIPAPLVPKHENLRSERVRSIRQHFLALDFPRRFTLEIGSGHGHFLTAYAAAHRERFCLGIDIVRDRLQRSDRKRNRAALANVTFLRAEASEFLSALPEQHTIDEVFILFPDPWPKRRHHKNRLMRTDFLAHLAQRCSSGAALFFRTDHPEYFDTALAALDTHPDWNLSSTLAWPFELETVFQARADTFQSIVALRR